MDREKVLDAIRVVFPEFSGLDIQWEAAEIVYKVGVEEVVEWVKLHLHDSPQCSYDYCFPNRVWQAQLKKWEE